MTSQSLANEYHMTPAKRAFILGAGFSKPAGMPLATELLPSLTKKIELDDTRNWLEDMHQRLAWLGESDQQSSVFKLNIEQVFHYAHFDVEVHRIRQHLTSVGRQDGPDTPWNAAESISNWLSYLAGALCDVILECDNSADLTPIIRWAKKIEIGDSVVTFNYDALVERALSEVNKSWNHGLDDVQKNDEVTVCKLHGSIDWIVAHRSERFSKLNLLFEKANANRPHQNTGHVEDDYRLWRCRTREQLNDWISGRELQSISSGASPRTVGIAGLGPYKQLHQIPGLGLVWNRGMRAIYESDHVIIVGFSMSEYDAMAQMQFGGIARQRQDEGRPLTVTVIDPFVNKATQERFQRVFRSVNFVKTGHEIVDWTRY